MGAWGIGLFDDDLASDVRLEFDDLVARGTPPGQAADRILMKYASEAEDPDDGPVLLLAVTTLLLDSGVGSHRVYDQAARILDTAAGLERWREDASAEDLAERSAVYESLKLRLSTVVSRDRTSD